MTEKIIEIRTMITDNIRYLDYSDYERRLQMIEMRGRLLELRYNHNHDEKGRFCSGGGGGRMSSSSSSKNLEKSLDNSGKSNIIEENEMFHTEADPIREYLGSAEQSHPEKLNEMLDYLKSVNVDVIVRENNESMGYQPGLSSGTPGQIVINKNASISAWMHEVQHVKDDYEAGWSGMKILWDYDERYRREKRAYDVEIKFAKELNYNDVVKRLEKLLENERKRIYYE